MGADATGDGGKKNITDAEVSESSDRLLRGDAPRNDSADEGGDGSERLLRSARNDIDDLLAEGLLMGLGRKDFMALTPKQYALFREAYFRKEYETVQRAWEVERWGVFRAMCPPKGDRIGLKDLIEFPWEKKEKTRGREGEKGRKGEGERLLRSARNDGSDQGSIPLSGKERFEYLVKKWDSNGR